MKVAATVLVMQVTVHVSVLSDFLETEVLQKSDAGKLFCSVDMVFSKVCKGRCKGKKGKSVCKSPLSGKILLSLRKIFEIIFQQNVIERRC